MDKVRFTPEEDTILRQAHCKGYDYCVSVLPGRTKKAVFHRAKRLGLGYLRKFKDRRPRNDTTLTHAFNQFLGVKTP